MSTGIVAAALLMYRRGVSEEFLVKTVNNLTKYILRKGYKVCGVNETSSNVGVRNAVTYLNQATTKTKKSIFELQISAGN